MGKKAVCIFLFMLITLLSFGQGKEIITVLDFKTSAVSHEEMVVFVDYLVAQIVESGKFTVIDRTQRGSILKEQEFSVTDCVEESCQLSIGKMLAAKYIMVGSIGKFGDMFILNTKFINVETGETIKTSSEKYASLNYMLEDSQQIVYELMDIESKGKPVAVTKKDTARDKPPVNTPSPPALIYFADEFDKPTLDSRWYWQHEPQNWSLTKKPGYFRFYPQSETNVLLTNLEPTDFQIDTKLELKPRAVFKRAGISLDTGDAGNVSFYLAYEWEGDKVIFMHTKNGKWDGKTAIYGSSAIYLRIVKKGTKLACFFSKDGIRFTPLGESEISAQGNFKAGLMGATIAENAASTCYAYFDYFRVSKPD